MTQIEIVPNELTPIAHTVEVSTETDSAEAELTDEIGKLWKVHGESQTSLHSTRDELRAIRADLALKLHQLKAVLSRPGRGGAWSSFLASQRIPRSTADRLVRGHEKTTMADGESCTGEQFHEPAEDIRSYVNGLWPRLSRLLKTRDAVEVFVTELRRKANASFEAKAAAPDTVHEMLSLGAVTPTSDYACMV